MQKVLTLNQLEIGFGKTVLSAWPSRGQSTECIEADLERRHFLYIPPERIGPPKQLLAKEDRWQKIWERFPSTRYDSMEAVFCYSLERNTARVFHSMRVAEIGLRSLARRMKVKLPKRKRLEWAEWQDMLREMNVITEKVAMSKASPARQELLEFIGAHWASFMDSKMNIAIK